MNRPPETLGLSIRPGQPVQDAEEWGPLVKASAGERESLVERRRGLFMGQGMSWWIGFPTLMLTNTLVEDDLSAFIRWPLFIALCSALGAAPASFQR